MAPKTGATDIGRVVVGTWQRGVGAGVAAVIPMITDNVVLGGKELFLQFGLIPFAVLWGVLYAGLARHDRVERLAARPLTGVGLGTAYSFLVWMGPQVGEPLGQGVFTVGGAVQVVTFGLVLGLVYAYSPHDG